MNGIEILKHTFNSGRVVYHIIYQGTYLNDLYHDNIICSMINMNLKGYKKWLKREFHGTEYGKRNTIFFHSEFDALKALDSINARILANKLANKLSGVK